MHIPYRTGLTTIRKLLEKICQLLVRYEEVINRVLPPSQHVYVAALRQACNDFLLNTDNPRPE